MGNALYLRAALRQMTFKEREIAGREGGQAGAILNWRDQTPSAPPLCFITLNHMINGKAELNPTTMLILDVEINEAGGGALGFW